MIMSNRQAMLHTFKEGQTLVFPCPWPSIMQLLQQFPGHAIEYQIHFLRDEQS